MGPPPLQTATHATLFLAIPIPAATQALLTEAITAHYGQYVERLTPPERWHLTLVWLGAVENPIQYLGRLTSALPQSFLPTVSLMHLGRGLQRSQLWAYAHPSTSLVNLRQQLIARLKKMRCPIPASRYPEEFLPHIRVADMYELSRGIGLADYATPVSFAVNEILLYQSYHAPDNSRQYHTEGVIALT